MEKLHEGGLVALFYYQHLCRAPHFHKVNAFCKVGFNGVLAKIAHGLSRGPLN